MQPALLVIGSGTFARLLIIELLSRANAAIIVASRRRENAQKLCRELGAPRLSPRQLDLRDAEGLSRSLAGVAAVLCAAGPFQDMPLTLAGLCLERRVPYIDIADARGFVLAARELATDRRVESLYCPGWSTTPALTALLAAKASAGFDRVDAVLLSMTVGLGAPPGPATVSSFLHSSAPGGLIETADVDLLPRLLGARKVEFRADFGPSPLSKLTTGLSFAPRRLVSSNSVARAAAAIAEVLAPWGSSAGGLRAEISGSKDGIPARRIVSVKADKGARRLAVLPAAHMTARLLAGTVGPGLPPLDRWIEWGDFEKECAGRGFRAAVEELHA